MEKCSELEKLFSFYLLHTLVDDEQTKKRILLFEEKKFDPNHYKSNYLEESVHYLRNLAKQKTEKIVDDFTKISNEKTTCEKNFNLNDQISKNEYDSYKFSRELLTYIDRNDIMSIDEIKNALHNAIKSFHSLIYLYSAVTIGNKLLDERAGKIVQTKENCERYINEQLPQISQQLENAEDQRSELNLNFITFLNIAHSIKPDIFGANFDNKNFEPIFSQFGKIQESSNNDS